MNYLHSIGLQNTGPFKDLKFDIKPGISMIYGLNRAGGRNSKNSNGVGKSFLGGAPREIVYDSPSVGEKSDRVRHGTRSLEFTNYAGKRILVERQAKGRGEKIKIVEDGVDKEFRTPTIAKSYIEKAWPLTDEEYDTYVAIDSRVPHPLVMGKSAERLRFFTEFFNITKIDAERKLYSAELSNLKRVRAAYDELRAQADKLRADILPTEEREKLEARVKRLRKQLKTLQDRFTGVQDTLRLMQFADSAKESIQILADATAEGEITHKEFERLQSDNAWELKKCRAELEDAERWEQYKRDNERYMRMLEKLSPFAAKLLNKYGDDVFKKTGPQAELRMHQSVNVQAADHAYRVVRDRLRVELPPRVEKPEEDEGDLQTLLRVYKHHLEHAEQFEDGKCETCGQPVKIKDPALVQKKIKTIKQKLLDHEAYREYKEALNQRRKDKADILTLKAELEKERAEEDRLSKWEDAHEELCKLPERPEPFVGKKLQTVVLKKMIEELNERRSLLRYMEPHLDSVIDFQKLTKEQIKEAAESHDLALQMNELQDKCARFQAKLEVQETLSERLADMRTRLREMREELKDEEPLKLLVQGFQDKNIKKMIIEAISQRLMALVNKYAAMILPEQFTFEFKWESDIKILCHRPESKEPIDVRRLSGAESTLFTLILVCALLAFVPSKKRSSVLILDEPTARLSDEMTQVFVKLVRIMNTLIPSIVILSPKMEIIEGAHVYTVVKNKGVSQIVEGFPNQQKVIK
jgi:DNA repair exonuclease SbcCD ATPase subunit